MQIVYFTTAMQEDDYKEFCKIWKISLNSSNQNFHNKLIRSLALTNKVDVISIRPFAKKLTCVKKLPYEKRVDSNITWHYLSRKAGRLNRALSPKKQAFKLLKDIDVDQTIFITDTINTGVSYTCLKVKSQFIVPTIGICTDNPENITGSKKSINNLLLALNGAHSGYIYLTDGLNFIYNPSNAPSIKIEGIVEDYPQDEIENKYGDYFFFGGALLKRYGVYELIEAFKSLNNNNIKLVICGHHPEPELQDYIKEDNIVYLGCLPVKEVNQLEKNAIACINPRPYQEEIDKYSIPSKTLEYLANGVPTISMPNTILQNIFPDEVFWVEDNKIESLKITMQKVLNMNSEERKSFAAKGERKVKELYSLNAINKKLDEFLFNFIK